MIATFVLAAALQSKTEWAPTVAGLTGKVVVGRQGEKNGTPVLIPYLVLKNMTDVLGTIDIYLSERNLKLKLVDETGHPIPDGKAGLNGRNGFVPNPFWLQLPYDSKIQINASLSGCFAREPGQLLMETDAALLYLPKDYAKPAYLQGTFSVTDTPHEARGMRWEGTLALPPVKVFDGKQIVLSLPK